MNTVNFDGTRKRLMGKRKIIYYKYRDFKKVYVSFKRDMRAHKVQRGGPVVEEEVGEKAEEVV